MPAMVAPTEDSIAIPANLELEEAERRYAKAILDRCDGKSSGGAVPR